MTSSSTPAATAGPTRPRPSRRLVRAGLAVAVAAGLVLLAACGDDNGGNAGGGGPSATSSAPASGAPNASGSPSPSGSPQPSIEPSKNLDAVEVSGDYGEKPKVTVKTPWAITETQSEVLEEGDGDKVQETDSVKVDYQGVNGRTGKVFDTSFDKGGEPVPFPLDGVIPGFRKGLVGKHVGDRVLIAMTGPDGYDQSGGNPQAGIQVGDTLLFVADITAATLEQADGEQVQPPDDLPSVDTDGDLPQLSLPDADPPADITVQPLISGDGEKVGKTDLVTTKSMTWVWDGDQSRVADESWQEAWQPDVQAQQTRLTAMQEAMAGHRVGDRLLVVFPPGTAYPNGDRAQQITEDDTVVMVIDVLFTQPGQQ